MNRCTILRSLDAPVDRVWAIVGRPAVSPGPGVHVTVEQPGSEVGTGLIRAVRVGPVTVHEEITGVGPGKVLKYRLVKGAPVRDYTGTVTLEGSPAGGTQVSWVVQFRPSVPGTGWLVSLLTRRTLNRVLDAVSASLQS